MERILILFIAVFFFAACGTKTVELGNPDFPDNNAAADDDTVVSDSDSDSQIDPDSDSNMPDSDSAIDPDDDTTMPDNDSVIDPDDDTVIDPDDDTVIIPDDDAVVTECTIGERKCDDTLDNVLECNVAHEWISVEDCSAPLKMCVESPADNFFCDDLVCEPGVKFCKNEDLYTCNTDGQGDTLAQNCTDTQYCDTVSLTCEDMVCEPSDIYCDGSVLKNCNTSGSGFTEENCAATSMNCYDIYESCAAESVFTTNESNQYSGKNRLVGNVIQITSQKNLLEFSSYLEDATGDTVNFYIYKNTDGTNYSKIFQKSITLGTGGKSYYSSGYVNEILEAGNYIFGVVQSGTNPYHFAGNKASGLYIGTVLGTVAVPSFTGPDTFSVSYSTDVKVFMMKSVSK